jgi:hypothetical protein
MMDTISTLMCDNCAVLLTGQHPKTRPACYSVGVRVFAFDMGKVITLKYPVVGWRFAPTRHERRMLLWRECAAMPALVTAKNPGDGQRGGET